jgi:hypothetical protein
MRQLLLWKGMNQIEETLIMFFGLKPGGCYWICANELQGVPPHKQQNQPSKKKISQYFCIEIMTILKQLKFNQLL